MTDYTYWHKALTGDYGPLHDGDPQPGFYRRRKFKGGPLVGVAIWPDENGKIVAVCDKAEVAADDVWTWCARDAVSEAAYKQWEATGGWPDEDPVVAAGHNNPPADDDVAALREQIAAAKASADDYAEVNDDETAAKAQSLRSRLNELSRNADKKRDELKRPHLEAGREIDAEWMPLVKEAKSAADDIAKALGAHETRKARAEAEVRRKAEEDQRRRDEEAAQAAAAGKPVPEPVERSAPAPAPEPTTKIKGAYGKAASVRAVKVATVVDQDAAYSFLKTHKELVDLMAKLAQRAVDAGYEVPGVRVEEERKVA